MRIISRLDIKSHNLIKGIRFEGLRKIGEPAVFANRYYAQGVDEILFIDTVASLYGRSQMGDLLSRVSESVFVPLTVGGGVRNLQDAELLFQHGADKVAINTRGFVDHEVLYQIAAKFGSQALVGSIHAKRKGSDWECLVEQGRERTGISLSRRIKQLIDLGVGEVLVTSVDNDGVRRGFDLDLCDAALEASSVPVVFGGGCGSSEHLLHLRGRVDLSAVAIGSAFHFGDLDVPAARRALEGSL